MTYEKEIEAGSSLIKIFFKDKSGKPFEATETQINIFLDIYLMRVSRMAILGMTRYGKSETASMGILLRSLIYKENFVIGANSKEIAQILMNKCIEHLSDNPIFNENLVLVDKVLTNKLKKKESKDEFTWVNGGGIKTVTLGANTKKSEVEALIGEGTNRLILEEASAISNNLVGMAMRMLGDNAKDNFCLKLGNALYRSHFMDSINSPKYKSYVIDWNLALKEGRVTEEFIEEQKQVMTRRQFESMYECKFPDEDEADKQGFKNLFFWDDFYLRDKDGKIKRRQQIKEHRGDKYLGADPSEGRDENCCQMRSKTRADLIFNSHIEDIMAQGNIIMNLAIKNNVDQGNVFVDGTGVGVGVVHKMKSNDFYPKDIRWASADVKNKMYLNKKAENYFDLKNWVEKGGYISDEKTIEELLTIKWKERENDNKIIIKPKDLQLAEGIKSQNRADALALTFNNSGIPNFRIFEMDDD